MSLLSFGKSLLTRVGDVRKQGSKLRVRWANYVGFGLIAFSGSMPGGIFSGRIKTGELKSINKKYYDKLKEKGVAEVGVFIIIIDDKATIWEVDLDLIKMMKNPTSDFGVRNSLSGFLRAFILNYIKGVIKMMHRLFLKTSMNLKARASLCLSTSC